jgi:hypothetical protein
MARWWPKAGVLSLLIVKRSISGFGSKWSVVMAAGDYSSAGNAVVARSGF